MAGCCRNDRPDAPECALSTAAGFEGYSITIGGSNSGRNTTTAFITNGPMVAGQLYTFTSESNVGGAGEPFATFACFTMGIRIRTPAGDVLIENLCKGDVVTTRDHGNQIIRWIGRRTVPAHGRMAPILFQKGMLGATDDIRVSPNHRMLLTGSAPQLWLGVDTVLVAAKALVNGTTIAQQPTGFVTYMHLMFDQHEIIWGNDCPSESFFAGKAAIDELDNAQRTELYEIFPELCHEENRPEAKLAHSEAKTYEGQIIGAYL